jgi:endonuclease/exonuclease/phosphatase family metal-dependent hydrolase
MRVMTFNLRFENDRDGENAWFFRKEQVCRVIQRYAPALLGTQEGRWSQLLFLRDQLPDYRLHAPDRVVDDTCQYPTLFFRQDRFDLVDGDEYWLSKTPRVHRSKNWDSAFPRMMSYACLNDRETGKAIRTAVTHLDHIGRVARLEQAGMLAAWAREQTGPTILMGDFNDHPQSAVHAALTAPRTGLADTWEVLGRPEGEGGFTHHGFNGVPEKTRMDWILVSSHFRVQEAGIAKDHEHDRYPSDHFPYWVDLDLRLKERP